MGLKSGYRPRGQAHPGGFVGQRILKPLGLTVTAAAGVLGVTRAALSAVLNERASLSPDMALRIEKAFGASMDSLMRMQNNYDIAQTRKRESEIDVAPYVKPAAGPVAAVLSRRK